MVLLRRLLGEVLRGHRTLQGRTLRDVSTAAGVSLGYLSEIERGRKEASSELLAAICDALTLSLADVLREVSDQLVREERRPVLTPIGFPGTSRLARPATGPRPVAGVPPLRTARPMPAHRPVGPGRHDRPPTRPVSPATPVATASLSSSLRAPALGASRVPLSIG